MPDRKDHPGGKNNHGNIKNKRTRKQTDSRRKTGIKALTLYIIKAKRTN